MTLLLRWCKVAFLFARLSIGLHSLQAAPLDARGKRQDSRHWPEEATPYVLTWCRST